MGRGERDDEMVELPLTLGPASTPRKIIFAFASWGIATITVPIKQTSLQLQVPPDGTVRGSTFRITPLAVGTLLRFSHSSGPDTKDWYASDPPCLVEAPCPSVNGEFCAHLQVWEALQNDAQFPDIANQIQIRRANAKLRKLNASALEMTLPDSQRIRVIALETGVYFADLAAMGEASSNDTPCLIERGRCGRHSKPYPSAEASCLASKLVTLAPFKKLFPLTRSPRRESWIRKLVRSYSTKPAVIPLFVRSAHRYGGEPFLSVSSPFSDIACRLEIGYRTSPEGEDLFYELIDLTEKQCILCREAQLPDFGDPSPEDEAHLPCVKHPGLSSMALDLLPELLAKQRSFFTVSPPGRSTGAVRGPRAPQVSAVDPTEATTTPTPSASSMLGARSTLGNP